jgi:ribonuclease HII
VGNPVSREYLVGIDENGLGALLGPMVVTAVAAEVDEPGRRFLARRLPKYLRQDLDDSKRLVSHNNTALGEAWARALVRGANTPEQLWRSLCLEDEAALEAPCPKHASAQCWTPTLAGFSADEELSARIRGHVAALEKRGVRLLGAHSSILCTKVLNLARKNGGNRFVSDLHAMERLLLHIRPKLDGELVATCGKVGGITDYSKFFGPLSGWLHAVVEVGRARSTYRFPRLGQVSFVRDADASDPLVMLASLVGKYIRELLMGKISSYYDATDTGPSGYHDPVTRRFILDTSALRKRRKIPSGCFERDGLKPPVDV